jgi:polysaccharide biosynthesis protein PslH
MRILFLSPFLPCEAPRHGGEKLLFETLQHLSARHELALVALSGPDALPASRRLQEFCRVIRIVEKDVDHIHPARRFANLFSRTPSWFLHTASREMISRIRELESFRPDVVQVEFLGMAPYVKWIDHPTVVYNSHEAFGRSWLPRAVEPGPGALAAYLLWDYRKLVSQEARLLSRFRAVLCFSREDRDYFVSRNRDASVHVWTPGIRIPARRDDGGCGGGGRDGTRMLFVGAFRHPPNVEGIRFFCRKILPRVLRSHPGAHLDVVGPEPPPSVRSLQGPAVSVHGYVEDLAPWYARRPVFVVPVLRGGGIRIKNLEALGNGLPVVTTPEGAEGIDALHGEHWFVARGPEAFAAGVCRFLSDPGLSDRTGRQAREWAEGHLRWVRAAERLEAVYARVLQTRAPPRDIDSDAFRLL